MPHDPLHIRLRDIPEAGLTVDLELPEELVAEALAGVEAEPSRSLVRLALDLQRVGASVYARGALRGALAMRCARCLGSASVVLDVPLEITFTESPAEEDGREGESVLDEADFAPITFVKGERILDLRGVLLEQIVLSIPLKPLCREDCPGLCPTCGADLNQGACGCPRERAIDPRFAPLATLRDSKHE